MLSAVMLSVVMLSVVMLSVVMLSVVYAGCLVFDEKRAPSANKVVSDVYANVGNSDNPSNYQAE